MKICYLAHANSVHTMRWAEYFVSKGHDVSLISFSDLLWDVKGLNFYKLDKILSKRLDFMICVPKVKALLKRIKPDILHVHYASDYGFLAALVGFRPYILSVWGSDIYVTPKRSFIHKKMAEYSLRKADIVCSTSKAMSDETKKYLPERKNIIITPFGIDLNKFKPMQVKRNPGQLVIGTVKSLVKGKNLGNDLLISVFAGVVKRFDKVILKIVGHGEHRNDLEEMARRLNLKDKVRFLGYKKHSDIPRFLNGIDIYCCFSRNESFGVAPLEASACEKPVVASKREGLLEVVEDRETGILVDIDDKGEVVDALYKLLMDADLRKKMGANGRKFVKDKYDWLSNAKLMENTYSEILNAQ